MPLASKRRTKELAKLIDKPSRIRAHAVAFRALLDKDLTEEERTRYEDLLRAYSGPEKIDTTDPFAAR